MNWFRTPIQPGRDTPERRLQELLQKVVEEWHKCIWSKSDYLTGDQWQCVFCYKNIFIFNSNIHQSFWTPLFGHWKNFNISGLLSLHRSVKTVLCPGYVLHLICQSRLYHKTSVKSAGLETCLEVVWFIIAEVLPTGPCVFWVFLSLRFHSRKFKTLPVIVTSSVLKMVPHLPLKSATVNSPTLWPIHSTAKCTVLI